MKIKRYFSKKEIASLIGDLLSLREKYGNKAHRLSKIRNCIPHKRFQTKME
jgi:hypothetical protein